MKTTTTIEVTDTAARIWEKLTPEDQQKISSRAISALLNGELYPTGTDQIDLAVDLAEAGLPSEIISKLTRLNPEIFESFIKK
jgi:hypothetical protein